MTILLREEVSRTGIHISPRRRGLEKPKKKKTGRRENVNDIEGCMERLHSKMRKDFAPYRLHTLPS